MSSAITCPSCSFRFEITEVMSAQLAEQIRAELEAELGPERQRLARQSEELLKRQAALEQSRQGLDDEILKRMAVERERLNAEARRKAAEDVAVELRDRDEQLKEAAGKLKHAQERELVWRKRERELDQAQEELARKQEEMADALRRQLAQERQKLLEEGQTKAATAFAEQITDRDRRIQECEEQIKAGQAAQQAVRDREQELSRLQEELRAQRDNLQEQVKAELARERQRLIEQVAEKAREEAAAEIKERETQLDELRGKLKAAAENELALRKRAQELSDKADQMELEVARRLDEERGKIRQNARKEADVEHELAIRQKEVQMDQMRRQIEDLRRKAEQGSQQLQGEALEVALEDLLRRHFPADSIGEVPKGVRGADVMQLVCGGGVECGSILWESKRTKNWSDGWLEKLRDDQRAAKADLAIIVTSAMPAGEDHFCCMDGVWVCSWSCAVAAAGALRVGLLEVAKARRAMEGQNGKMEQVYQYLASPQFKHRMTGILEAFVTMQRDLESEKRALQTQWNKRQKQLERAIDCTTGLYGDFRGMIGGTLSEIEGMSLLQLEADNG